MPHCIIEHSSRLDSHWLMGAVQERMLASGLFGADGRDIKVRSLAYERFTLGSGLSDFVHVTIKMLSGRSEAQKKDLAAAVMEGLRGLALADVEITVEIQDTDRGSYQKFLISAGKG